MFPPCGKGWGDGSLDRLRMKFSLTSWRRRLSCSLKLSLNVLELSRAVRCACPGAAKSGSALVFCAARIHYGGTWRTCCACCGGPGACGTSFVLTSNLLARLHLDSTRPRAGRSLGYRSANDAGRSRQAEAAQFRGATDAQHFAGWLRAILANHLALAVRRFGPRGGGRAKCSLIQDDLDPIVEPRLEAFLAVGHSSPSERAIRSEQAVHLAAALAKLPEDQAAVPWNCGT